jgi:hypothetical protein
MLIIVSRGKARAHNEGDEALKRAPDPSLFVWTVMQAQGSPVSRRGGNR